MAREHRWIILAEDGRHVTLGRDSDPSDEEVALAGKQLGAQRLGGWLAVLEGSYHQARGVVSLLMVREVAPSTGAGWEQAEAAFWRQREATVRAV